MKINKESQKIDCFEAELDISINISKIYSNQDVEFRNLIKEELTNFLNSLFTNLPTTIKSEERILKISIDEFEFQVPNSSYEKN